MVFGLKPNKPKIKSIYTEPYQNRYNTNIVADFINQK